MLKHMFISAGIGAGLPLLAGAAVPPPADLWWMPYALSVLTGLATGAMHVGARVFTARKRAKAELDKARAEAMLADDDPTNDAAARELLLQAKLDVATADVLDREIDKRETKE
jgi:hypothetical protein